MRENRWIGKHSHHLYIWLQIIVVVSGRRRSAGPGGSGSAPLALAGADRRAPAFAVDEAALGQVIGRHFDAHGIADDRPDAETPHPASRIDDDPMTKIGRAHV